MKKILFAMAMLVMGCDTESMPCGEDAGVIMTSDASPDAEVDAMPDSDVPDASPPDARELQPGCGELNHECCYPDGAPPGCDQGLACDHQEAQPQSVCHPITCQGATPGLCPGREACVYNVDHSEYQCVHCGDVGEFCCQGHCEGQELNQSTCTGGFCVAL